MRFHSETGDRSLLNDDGGPFVNQDATNEEQHFGDSTQGDPITSQNFPDGQWNNSAIEYENPGLSSSGYSTEGSFVNPNGLAQNEDAGIKGIQILMPISHHVKKLFPNGYVPKRYNVPSLIYHGGPFSEEVLKRMYSTILRKYFSAMPFYSGKLVNRENRKIDVRQWYNDKSIAGSDDCMGKIIDETMCRIAQNGQLYLLVTISFPLNNSETIASFLMQKDFVVTQRLSGNEQDIYERAYEVHDHKANENCTEQCNKKLLDDFLREDFDISPFQNELVPVYVLSSLKKMKEFITDIANCPTNPLCAEEYSFYPTFKENGEMLLTGIVWPKLFSKFNGMIADFSYGLQWKEEVCHELLQTLEREIITRTDIDVFQDNYRAPLLVAQKAMLMSDRTQVHFDNCSECKSPELPSIVSFISKPYITQDNIYPAKRLKHYMKQFLEELSIEEKCYLTINEFLSNVHREKVNLIYPANGIVTVILPHERLEFHIDDSLHSLLDKYQNEHFTSIYLYSIMFSETRKVYLKKAKLKEVYTHPYSYFYLQAAKSFIEVLPTIGSSQFLSAQCSNLSNVEHNLHHHRRLSLAEAIATLDGRISRLKDSQGIVSVSLAKSDFFTVRKVSGMTPISFCNETNSCQFEEIVSMKKKFLNRLNGKFLTLAEFLIWYEPVKEDDIEIYQAYKNNIENIQESEIRNLDGTHVFPTCIIISNGDVVELRKKRKVLQVFRRDMAEDKELFCQYMLYSKYLNTEDVSEEEIVNLSNQQLPIDDMIPCSLLHFRRRQLFPYNLKDFV